MESAESNYNSTSVRRFITIGWEATQTTTEDTFMEEVEAHISFKIANFVSIYWFPFLVPTGLVGNVLSFLVMIKSNNRNMSTCIYMATININDNLMMCICFHDYLVSVLHIHRWKTIECKISAFLTLFALQNGIFQVLAMTLDKYIAIKWPHKASTHSRPERTKMITLSLSVFAFVYNIPTLFLSYIIGGQCFNFGIRSVITRVYSWFSFVLNAIIPFTLLIHMNFVIVKTVRNSGKFFKTNDTNTGMEARHKAMKSAEKQVTIMLLLVTTLFLILLCPTYIRFIYLVFAKQDTPLDYAISMLLFQVTYKLYSSNSGINFFLYCISGQKFRNDLKEILCCKFFILTGK